MRLIVMRLTATALAGLCLAACAGLPARPPLGQVLVLTGAVIAAGAIAEHRQANHLVPTNDAEKEAPNAERNAELLKTAAARAN